MTRPTHAATFRALPANNLPAAALLSRISDEDEEIAPSDEWIGRVLCPSGGSRDGRPAPAAGSLHRVLRPAQPVRQQAAPKGQPLDTGIAAIDLFAPMTGGQRIAMLARGGASRAGLFGMLGRFTDRDVVVIGLIGLAERDVRELVQNQLGAEGMSRAVVIAAFDEDGPVMRRRAAWAALTIAEHFRDAGKHVLCLLDSISEFADACRELSVDAGEVRNAFAYTPHIFDEVHRLISRAGILPGGPGEMTGIFAVSESADRPDDLLVSAVSEMVDDRIVLDREIAAKGRFPAIDLLDRAHRDPPAIETGTDHEKTQLIAAAHAELSLCSNMEELVRLGAYTPGRNAEVDRALSCAPAIENLMKQSRRERRDSAAALAELKGCLS
ncbi:flagellum-specific ATP synthase FliI [Pacificimonas sp. WHA3]|uniref:Flagellum-specific ATP synthase FliI n=1 Tax=Pacificimonas pallii TaxID=2827236 RepID=A0ABS6SGY2_9SPHN|nr:flagellum-specific ATP synthase FliI [Pacificimonas pallii]MBV7257667.1 flagellum-specific ATP synthase FliI [Pacificimonas pallii]